MSFNIEERLVKDLIPYENNPRKNDHAIGKMVKVIEEFGFRVPILIKNSNEIIDGHLRYKAALAMKLEKVPTIITDDLSPTQIRAFRLMINRSATWAEWDNDALIIELKHLMSDSYDLSFTGFDQRELDAMIISMELEDTDKNPDDIPPIPKTLIIQQGEIWLLGNHRLMCGDSRSVVDMGNLMRGSLADMVWTDPPYNVDYQGAAGKIKNDKMSAEKFDNFLLSFFQVTHDFMREGSPIYVAHAETGDGMAFRRAFHSAKFKLAACLIWRKQSSVLSRGDYHFQHEPILYGWKKGAAHKWYGNRKQKSVLELGLDAVAENEDGSISLLLAGNLYRLTGENIQIEELANTVISHPKPVKSELHPTTKPVGLIQIMLANSSTKNSTVLDPFGGSGSTLIACEILGRNCKIMEIDPRFVEVIIQRWEDFTGKTAYRESDGISLSELI